MADAIELITINHAVKKTHLLPVVCTQHHKDPGSECSLHSQNCTATVVYTEFHFNDIPTLLRSLLNCEQQCLLEDVRVVRIGEWYLKTSREWKSVRNDFTHVLLVNMSGSMIKSAINGVGQDSDIYRLLYRYYRNITYYICNHTISLWICWSLAALNEFSNNLRAVLQTFSVLSKLAAIQKFCSIKE